MKALWMLIISGLLLGGCASITQEKAEAAAFNFAKLHVKPYSKDAAVTNASLKVISSSRQGNDWIVTIEFEGYVNESLRKAPVSLLVKPDLTVAIANSPFTERIK